VEKEWGWTLGHTLSSDRFWPNATGKIASATLTNTGKSNLHISRLGIEFEWQRNSEDWWVSDCSAVVKPGDKYEFSPLDFQIPIWLKPERSKYKLAVGTKQWNGKDWIDHKNVWGAKEYEVLVTRHPERDYKLFLSHCNLAVDKPLLTYLRDILLNNGFSVFVAEDEKKYGKNLWSKIKNGILASERVIVLWSHGAAVSLDVREELGITIGARKQFIPIVEKGAPLRGSMTGAEFLEIDRNNYHLAFQGLVSELIVLADERNSKRKVAHAEKIRH